MNQSTMHAISRPERKSSVDAEHLDAFTILLAAHDHVWDNLALIYTDRFEASQVLWSLALKQAMDS